MVIQFESRVKSKIPVKENSIPIGASLNRACHRAEAFRGHFDLRQRPARRESVDLPIA
jgi:hypothetical protein